MAKTKVKTEHIKEEKPPISRIANVGAETISNVNALFNRLGVI